MGREIKFRGLSNGVWYYGSLMQHFEDKVSYICWKGEILGNNLGVIQDQDLSEEVDFETVGQFTGLYDKNGKEIFEGDVVSIAENEDKSFSGGLILFDEDLYAYVIHKNNGGWDYINELKYIEIIGNIHENPELLEK